jgi:hypothetical protein
MTGTISARRRDVPHQIRNVRPREIFRSQFMWNHEKGCFLFLVDSTANGTNRYERDILILTLFLNCKTYRFEIEP